jgi:D-alanyl-D-alanine carboxypeptidase
LCLCEQVAGNAQKAPLPDDHKSVHNAFSLNKKDLENIVAELPAEIRDRILLSPDRFLSLMANVINEPAGMLTLVDKKHRLPSGYEPSDLVSMKDYPLKISQQYFKISSAVIPDLLEMAQAARKDGIELTFASTYRSESFQRTLYERNVKRRGRKEADRVSAQPGHSQHQLGVAVDFGSVNDSFTGTKMERWLNSNAWKYGFSLSYPKGREDITGYRYESWHYRYTGKPAAELERAYFGGVQQFMMEFFHSKGSIFIAKRTRDKSKPSPFSIKN